MLSNTAGRKPGANAEQSRAVVAEHRPGAIPSRRSTKRRAAFCLFATGLSLAFVWLWHEPLLRQVAEALMARDPLPVEVDFVCLTAGGDGLRAALAEYRSHPGCRFLLFPQRRNRLIDLGVINPGETRLRRRLREAGVTDAQIVVMPLPAADDWDLAEQLYDFLRTRKGVSAIILCDQSSGRRWRHVVCETAPADSAGRVHVRSVADAAVHVDDWWLSKAGIQRVFHGHLRLLFAVLHGRESARPDDSSPAAYEAAFLKGLQVTGDH
jgi:hypothetical protein